MHGVNGDNNTTFESRTIEGLGVTDRHLQELAILEVRDVYNIVHSVGTLRK